MLPDELGVAARRADIHRRVVQVGDGGGHGGGAQRLQFQPQDAGVVVVQHQQVQAAKDVPQEVAGAVLIHFPVRLQASSIK